MSTVGPSKPESLYKLTSDKNERRRLAAQVLAAHRPRVSAVARGIVKAEHVAEATQEGMLALLIALEKWHGNTSQLEDDVAFWQFARDWVRNGIQQWQDVGVYWRKRCREPGSPGAQEALKHRRFESLDEPAKAAGADTEETRIDQVPSTLPNSETICIAREELTVAANDGAARRYTDLEPEAREQGRGDRRRDALHNCRDTVRP